jgi:hypothetical protein
MASMLRFLADEPIFSQAENIQASTDSFLLPVFELSVVSAI